jgi:hypothetical protein
MTAKPDVATLVRELRATLDHIGDALVDGRYDDLMTTESRLAGVVSGFNAFFSGAFTEGPAPRPPFTELDEALVALRRCQRLGANLTELSAPWLVAGNPAAGSYDRSGHTQGQPYGHASNTTLQTRA